MLLSNSLFLDSEYKADVEYKINYLAVLKENIKIIDEEEITGIIGDEQLASLETKIMKATGRPYISDGNFLYGTKQISENYYKILLENHANNENL